MLTEAEATNFVANNLGIADVLNKLQSHPLDTLNDIIFKFHKRVPFQSLEVLFRKAGTLGVPDLQTVKKDVLNNRGGLCYTNNVFMKYLLDALRLKTFHVAGVCNPKHPNNHIATVVRDLQNPGQRLLVDVGCGFPTYQAIELTDQPEKIYRSAYLTYSFKKVSPEEFVRNHSTEPDGEPNRKCYDISMNPRDLPYFETAMLEVYRDRFPKKVRVMQFYDEKIVSFREAGNNVMKITFEGSTVTRLELTAHEDIVKHISEVLTCYSKAEIDVAIANWQNNLLDS